MARLGRHARRMADNFASELIHGVLARVQSEHEISIGVALLTSDAGPRLNRQDARQTFLGCHSYFNRLLGFSRELRELFRPPRFQRVGLESLLKRAEALNEELCESSSATALRALGVRVAPGESWLAAHIVQHPDPTVVNIAHALISAHWLSEELAQSGEPRFLRFSRRLLTLFDMHGPQAARTFALVQMSWAARALGNPTTFPEASMEGLAWNLVQPIPTSTRLKFDQVLDDPKISELAESFGAVERFAILQTLAEDRVPGVEEIARVSVTLSSAEFEEKEIRELTKLLTDVPQLEREELLGIITENPDLLTVWQRTRRHGATGIDIARFVIFAKEVHTFEVPGDGRSLGQFVSALAVRAATQPICAVLAAHLVLHGAALCTNEQNGALFRAIEEQPLKLAVLLPTIIRFHSENAPISSALSNTLALIGVLEEPELREFVRRLDQCSEASLNAIGSATDRREFLAALPRLQNASRASSRLAQSGGAKLPLPPKDWLTKLEALTQSGEGPVSGAELTRAVDTLMRVGVGLDILRKMYAHESRASQRMFLQDVLAYGERTWFKEIVTARSLLESYLHLLRAGDRRTLPRIDTESPEGPIARKELATFLVGRLADDVEESSDESSQPTQLFGERELGEPLPPFARVYILGGEFEVPAVEAIRGDFPQLDIRCYPMDESLKLNPSFNASDLVVLISRGTSHKVHQRVRQWRSQQEFQFRNFDRRGQVMLRQYLRALQSRVQPTGAGAE